MSYTLTENYQIDEFTIKAIIGENISDENCDFQKLLPERCVLTDENIICIFENGDALAFALPIPFDTKFSLTRTIPIIHDIL